MTDEKRSRHVRHSWSGHLRVRGEGLRRTTGRAKTHPPRVGVIERGRDALVYEQLGALAANGPPTDSCFSRLIMVARPFALSLVIP
jgi:hypothetical protein